MAVSFSQVGSLVVAGLNAAGTYTTTPSDPRFYTQQIKDACLHADAAVIETILANPTHPRRQSFLTSITVAHLGKLPDHIGPIESIIVAGKGASMWPKAEIENERRNSLGLTRIGAHYWLDGNILYHNDPVGDATVWYCTFTKSATDPPTLQSPDEYSEAVASKALAFLLNVEGENTAAAEFYDNHWRAFVNSIRGARALPEFDLFQSPQAEPGEPSATA